MAPFFAGEDEAPRSLAAAETAFAQQSVREGMRAAFIAHFAPDGLFVRKGWTRAREYLQDRPDPPIVLDWHPVYVETAGSGELGLSTGPWKLTSRGDPAAAATYGQFISIWKRERDGTWRVAVDLGVQHAPPALWDQPLETHAHAGGSTSATVADAESRFAAEGAARGASMAYAAHFATNVRLYRQGEPPALGSRNALAAVQRESGARHWSVERSDMASSRDFGYALGHYDDASAPGITAGHFLRVWRFEPAGWRIALEVLQPASS
jgi:ketosteroid isomerase-like protein